MGGFLARLRRLLSEEPDVQVDPDKPRVSLELAYQRQLDALSRVRRVRADLASAGQRLDHQVGRLTAEADRLTLAAENALAAGDEGSAREALVRKHDLEADLTELDAQRRALAAEQESVRRAADDLRAAAESLRAQRERLLAAENAAEARRRVGAVLDELRRELDTVELRLADASDAAVQVQAELDTLTETVAASRDAAAGQQAEPEEPMRYQQPPVRGSGPGGGDLR